MELSPPVEQLFQGKQTIECPRMFNLKVMFDNLKVIFSSAQGSTRNQLLYKFFCSSMQPTRKQREEQL